MSGYYSHVILFISIILQINALVIPKSDGPSKRIYENVLSDEDHYKANEIHNTDYDHEAFLGEKGAKEFDDLSPEESKNRLGKIVAKIDTDKDSFVSMHELKEWIQLTQRRYIIEDSDRQWYSLDPEEGKGLSWQQYKQMTYGLSKDQNEDDLSQYKDMIDRDSRRWKKADVDNDGELSKEEFINFVHPEESQHMKDIVVVETIEDIDKNKDGKISLEEYIGDMWDDNDSETEPSWIESEKEQFTLYRDKDKSGFMEFDEVKSWILPDDYENSEAEAKHLLYESDVNRDNLLSKEEILNKHDLFVGSQATDFGEALKRHDEF